ncbi:hypothetical protein [Acidianus manzaensis]|uniref:Uncharacterized protein n=1 Tax=Acidianus manzaensis TaxID=282676 RepID=A0A1W6K058_9CREN|nr:hypothetical protein [Acidianus manzaensis]ARM75899.1 hypothetical protein B6F84_07560 [Acidianus manzaensis]
MSSTILQDEELQEANEGQAGEEILNYEYTKGYIDKLDLLFQQYSNTACYNIMSSAIANKIITKEQAQEISNQSACTIKGEYEAYNQNKFWLYPAIATTEGIGSTTQSIINIIRQGIVVKETDGDTFYYIGGCSNYWRSGNIVIFQGGKQIGGVKQHSPQILGGGKIKGAQLDTYSRAMEEGTMEICIIPLLQPANVNWINPTQYTLPNTNYPESINQVVLGPRIAHLLTYQPKINYYAIDLKNTFYYIGKDRHYYVSGGVINYLHATSGTFPYVYPGFYINIEPFGTNFNPIIFLGRLQVLAGNPKLSPLYTKSGKLYPDSYDYWPSSMFAINKVSIGCPVFTSSWVGGDSCSNYGVLGLVSGISEFWPEVDGKISSDRSLLNSIPPDGFEIGLYSLQLIKLPSDFSRGSILDFAKGLRQDEAVRVGLEGISRARRAISALVSSGILYGVAFSAVLAVEEWDSEGQIVSDARQYVDKLNRVYNEALSYVSSCMESLPNILRNEKVMYVQQVQEYLNGVMDSVNALADDSEIVAYLIGSAMDYLESQGIYC